MDDSFVNLGEVILTLLWQSGASESANACFVNSLSICYWLFKCRVLCIVCGRCVRESVCVCERERVTAAASCVCVCVCVFACVREGDKVTQSWLVCKHIRASSLCLSRNYPFWLELVVKLRTLLTVFTLVLKAETHDYRKGSYISDAACGVRPITMHWASWPIRADCACRKEGLCRKRRTLLH